MTSSGPIGESNPTLTTQTSGINSMLSVGGGIGLKKKNSDTLECPKSPGRMIKSPKTEQSKFVSAGTIVSKSPRGGPKNLDLNVPKGLDLNSGSNNNTGMLGKLSAKKGSITVSAPKEEKLEEIPQGKFPIRKIFGKVTDLKDTISKVQSENVDEYIEKISDLPSGEEGNPENNYEGYLYKLTKTKKLKRMYFRLIHKDMYCILLFK